MRASASYAGTVQINRCRPGSGSSMLQLADLPTKTMSCKLVHIAGHAPYHTPCTDTATELTVEHENVCKSPTCVDEVSREGEMGSALGVVKQGRCIVCTPIVLDLQAGVVQAHVSENARSAVRAAVA